MQARAGSHSAPAAFDAHGKRIIFYLYYDTRGEVDDYVTYKLSALRQHAEHIFVIVNGRITPEAKTKLSTVADTVWQRENVGFDVWGYKEALEHFGDARLAEYEELILMNYTWFGPIRPFGPVFDRMDALAVDFWGLTDHAAQTPNPFTGNGTLHRHIQSHWISVRRRMFLSPEWAEYWRTMPKMTSYTESVLKHEGRFTHHFERAGFRSIVAFDSADYPSDHPALFNADLLLADGCPMLKRRQFFHYPPFLDRHAVVGRWTLREVSRYDYPVRLILENLARNVAPHTLNADLAMLEVLPDVDTTPSDAETFNLAVIAHVDHPELAQQLLDRIASLPNRYDLFVTTTEESTARDVEAILERMIVPEMATYEIRQVPSRGGNDMSAFFVGCRDVITEGRYDLVIKLRTLRTRHASNPERYFARHQIENLLSSTGYAANMLQLFRSEQGLGVVFPPMAHIGFDVMGRGWGAARSAALKLMSTLKIRVPADDVSPLAPYGGMWVARPEALGVMLETDWTYGHYSRPKSATDGNLARAQELVIAQAAGERGFHARTVLNEEHAAISHTSLEYKLDQLLSTTIGYPLDQIQFLHRAGYMGRAGWPALTRMYLRLHRPALAKLLLPFYNMARRATYLIRALKSRTDNPPADDQQAESARA